MMKIYFVTAHWRHYGMCAGVVRAWSKTNAKHIMHQKYKRDFELKNFSALEIEPEGKEELIDDVDYME
jgi:hypothetical protein